MSVKTEKVKQQEEKRAVLEFVLIKQTSPLLIYFRFHIIKELRKRLSRAAWSIVKNKANIHVSQEKVKSYEEAFDKIRKATGTCVLQNSLWHEQSYQETPSELKPW